MCWFCQLVLRRKLEDLCNRHAIGISVKLLSHYSLKIITARVLLFSNVKQNDGLKLVYSIKQII